MSDQERNPETEIVSSEEISENETTSFEKVSEKERKKALGGGSKVAAFIFFAIAALVFGFFLVMSAAFLDELFSSTGTKDPGEALGSVIAIIFTAPFMFFSAAPSLLFTIIATRLLRRIQGSSDNEKVNVTFKVFLIISRVMLYGGLVLGLFVLAMLFAR